MKRIAVVTGAGGGIGRAFVALLVNEDVDEVWCVGRNEARLEELREAYGQKLVPLRLDLSDIESANRLDELLTEQQATVAFLVNNAGVGEKLGSYAEYTTAQIANLVTVNCTSVAAVCTVCIPHMARGSKIINLASQSAFQPVPYLNLYASSKAFVRHYTRALNVELKEAGITATAICPGWVDTEMLIREINGIQISYPGMVDAERVAVKAMADVKRGRDMSVCTLYVKYMHMLSKIFPQKAVMKSWTKAIRKYLK